MFDFLKKNKTRPDATVTPPSVVLRKAGIDPTTLTFKFTNNSVIIGGYAASEVERQRILELIGAIPQLQSVEDQMQIGPVPAAQPEDTTAEPVTTDRHSDRAESSAGAVTHTVVSGDTLWKISEHYYGKGSAYMKIFAANRDQLDDPDKIKVGQVLQIPPQ